MPKMTDQDFDNLFRQAANRIAPERLPGDWDDMQQRLEIAERDARARNISLYSMLVLLLLYSFVMPDKLKYGRSEQASIVPQVEQMQPSETVASAGADNSQIDERGTPAATIETAATGTPTNETARTETTAASSELTGPSVSNDNNASATPGGKRQQGQHITPSVSGLSGSERDLLPTDAKKDDGVGFTKPQQQPAGSNNGGVNNRTSEGSAQEVSGQHADAQPADAQLGDAQPGDVQSINGVQGKAEAFSVLNISAQNSTPAINTHGSGKDVTGMSFQSAAGNSLVAERGQMGSRNSAAYLASGGVNERIPSTAPLFAEPEQKPVGVNVKSPGTVVAAPTRPSHPLFVRLLVSPDFSSIDYGKAGKTGLNFGPMVEYGLSPRFSVSTGAIWSKKLYNQENPEKGYGPGGGYPARVNTLNGDCRIIDIPLNVTYYMLPGRKTNLFVTVGSSSYIMLNEDYVYTVWHNNKEYEYAESYSHENNEWFSMLNLSLGIQQQVGKRWFVQGEPFLKAPMKGVGAGKVNLVSTGVFVSVKYWINP